MLPDGAEASRLHRDSLRAEGRVQASAGPSVLPVPLLLLPGSLLQSGTDLRLRWLVNNKPGVRAARGSLIGMSTLESRDAR